MDPRAKPIHLYREEKRDFFLFGDRDVMAMREALFYQNRNGADGPFRFDVLIYICRARVDG